jgi:hypothetical protein
LDPPWSSIGSPRWPPSRDAGSDVVSFHGFLICWDANELVPRETPRVSTLFMQAEYAIRIALTAGKAGLGFCQEVANSVQRHSAGRSLPGISVDAPGFANLLIALNHKTDAADGQCPR